MNTKSFDVFRTLINYKISNTFLYYVLKEKMKKIFIKVK